MNAGIVILQDGTPCIAYDGVLPFAIRHVEFSREDYQVTLVYDTPERDLAREAPDIRGWKLGFPLDHRFVALLKRRGNVAVASVKNSQLSEIKMYSVIFAQG